MRTYGRLVRHGDAWVILDLEPHVRIKLKAVFPKVPKHSVGPYSFPMTEPAAADLDWFMNRYPLAAEPEVLDGLRDRRASHEATQASVARVFTADYAPPLFAGLRPGQAVRLHQARNVELLGRFGGLLVADRVGKGKTYTAGAACLMPGALPATIVVPPHLRLQWQKKLTEFTSLTSHVVATTKPYVLPPVDVRIFGYTQLTGWIDVLELLGTGLACFDEAHELRHGGDTAKGAAAARLCEVSRRRLMLTGTPVFNYGGDIWTLLSYVRPEVLGDRDDFMREWCGGGVTVKDPVALGAYLREQHAMTREVGEGDPDANRIVESVPHDAERLASVEEALRALAWTARHGSFTERGQAMRDLDLRLRQETGIAKAPFVAKFVRAYVEATGEPVMLFGWHREVYEIWLAELSDLGCVMYTGSESPVRKDEAARAFAVGEAKVFIMSLRSGAGLDGLQGACSTAIFGELDWSPSMHEQCVGRLNREGQRRWVTGDLVDAIFLVTDDGSDPPIMEMLGLKASQAQGITDPGLGARRVAVDRSPIERLLARYTDEVAA